MNEPKKELLARINELTDRQACIALEAWLYQLKHPETTPEECVHQAAEAAKNAPCAPRMCAKKTSSNKKKQ